MNEDRKKEIEAKLLQLIAETQKPEKSGSLANSISGNIKVIRRRKGNPDMHIV